MGSSRHPARAQGGRGLCAHWPHPRIVRGDVGSLGSPSAAGSVLWEICSIQREREDELTAESADQPGHARIRKSKLDFPKVTWYWPEQSSGMKGWEESYRSAIRSTPCFLSAMCTAPKSPGAVNEQRYEEKLEGRQMRSVRNMSMVGVIRSEISLKGWTGSSLFCSSGERDLDFPCQMSKILDP